MFHVNLQVCIALSLHISLGFSFGFAGLVLEDARKEAGGIK